jgi:hypothetical protein
MSKEFAEKFAEIVDAIRGPQHHAATDGVFLAAGLVYLADALRPVPYAQPPVPCAPITSPNVQLTEPPNSPPPISDEQLKDALVAAARVSGKGTALQVLKDFGLERVTEVPDERRNEIFAHLTGLGNAPQD